MAGYHYISPKSYRRDIAFVKKMEKELYGYSVHEFAFHRINRKPPDSIPSEWRGIYRYPGIKDIEDVDNRSFEDLEDIHEAFDKGARSG